jgi:nucleoid-associated protein YgaU
VTGNFKWMAIGLVAAAAGCQGNGGSKTAESGSIRSDVADIRPIESTTPAYQPAPFQPAPVQPVMSDTTAGAPSAGNTHVVKHGETLYSIAKKSYGDGKQWQRIASANPGVSPTTLKVGQTLVIP